MDDLIEGYRRFRSGTWRSERARFEELSRVGQRPRTLVIASWVFPTELGILR